MRKQDAQNFMKKVITALKTERLKQDISQYELAKRSGLDKTSILNIERFEQNPTGATLYMIAKTLNVRLGDIINSVDE